METIIKNMSQRVIACLFVLLSPIAIFAQQLTAEQEAEENKKMELYGEVGIGLLFAVSVVLFLVFKAKHDKKVREKQVKQMQQIQANRRKAA